MEDDLGYKLSIKSIEAYEKRNYVEAFFLQVETFENSIQVMITGRARHLGIEEKKVKKLACEGNLNKKIDNLIKVGGDDFRFLWEDLHNYRRRRNKIVHQKSEFRDEEELKNYAQESWLLGTRILSCFIGSIENYPIDRRGVE